MKLLFISMSARTISDCAGNIYLNSHMNKKTIQRYRDICDEFRMILRDSGIRCTEEEAIKKYDPFPRDLADLRICYNPYHPITNLFNVKKYREMDQIFSENIKWADKVIIASATGIYTETGIKYCKAYNKSYMLLVGGFAFETDWNHGLDGKFVAWKHEYECKKNMEIAPYGLYVTKESLQKRYPCHGKTVGCSDVEITDLNPDILKKRLGKTISGKGPITLGTVANIDDKLKGHKFVIKAISLLKQKGHKFEYYLLGAGSGASLMAYAERLGVKDQVILVGTKPHAEVYGWLDGIDVYIQPSFTEGLCRAVVEAMSRACPVICTDVGGNAELCSQEFLVRAGNAKEIADALEKMTMTDTWERQAKISFENAHEYYYEVLDEKRNNFLKAFVEF